MNNVVEKKEKGYYDAGTLSALIRYRFAPPVYAFLPQVRNGTGYDKDIRTADAIAMGLWPSRGLYLNGFEIKVNRGDWLNELKNPAKAEDIASYCDFWWVVAPKGLIKIEEMPINWGLMNPFGQTLKIIKQAIQLKPAPLDKLFLAAILRRAQEVITPEAKIKEALDKEKAEWESRANEIFDLSKTQLSHDYDSLREKVNLFFKASGVDISDTWSHGSQQIGEAVKLVLNGEDKQITDRLNSLLKTAEDIVVDIKEHLK